MPRGHGSERAHLHQEKEKKKMKLSGAGEMSEWLRVSLFQRTKV